MMRREDPSRIFYELSSLVLNILRSPPSNSVSFSGEFLAPERRSPVPAQITPAGFASLLLGVSVALMLCGSVTFFIGFILMPWVVGLVMVFYVVGVVSSLSVLGRAIICQCAAPASSSSSPRKEVNAWKVM